MDVKQVRKDFPYLKTNNIAYLDNTATTQKPKQVLDAVRNYYENDNANPHRGIYDLSERATEEYESCREEARKFVNAGSSQEIVFTRNATEGTNLVKNSFVIPSLKAGDEIVTTIMEHHANIVPWLIASQQKKLALSYIDVTGDEGFLEKNWEKRITKKTKLLCVTHASNTLGTINDVKAICETAKDKNPEIKVLIDGAQAAPHLTVDVKKFDCDFYVFSGHKMLAPMGIGVLYARKEVLEEMQPFLVGGDMIRRVEKHAVQWNDLPWKFEAGTPNVGGAVGLKAAIKYLKKLGLGEIHAHEQKLTRKAMEILEEHKRFRYYGPRDAKKRVGTIAFTHSKAHSHDLGSIFNEYGVCVRSGHHCTMPLHQRLGIPSSTRASFYVYNTLEEVEKISAVLDKVDSIFRG